MGANFDFRSNLDPNQGGNEQHARPHDFDGYHKPEGRVSNFGAGGKKHYRRKMVGQASVSTETALKFTEGGLGPSSGAILYGHHDIVGSISPEQPNQRRFPRMMQQGQTFVGMALPPADPAPEPPAADPYPWADHSDHGGKTPQDVVKFGCEDDQVFFGGQKKIASYDPSDTSHLFRSPDSPSPERPSKEQRWKRGMAIGRFSPMLRAEGALPSGIVPALVDINKPDEGTDDNTGFGRRSVGVRYLPEGIYAGTKSDPRRAEMIGKKMSYPHMTSNTFDSVGMTPKALGVNDETLQPLKLQPSHYAGGMPIPSERGTVGPRKKAYPNLTQNTFDSVGVTPKSLGVPDDVEPLQQRMPRTMAGASTTFLASHRVAKKPGYFSHAAKSQNTFESVGRAMVLLDDSGSPLGEPKHEKYIENNSRIGRYQ
jgi:hypothetical protein